MVSGALFWQPSQAASNWEMPARPVPRGGPAKTQHRETLSRDMLCQRERIIGINGRLVSPRLCAITWALREMASRSHGRLVSVHVQNTENTGQVSFADVVRVSGYASNVQVSRSGQQCGVTLRAFAQAQSRVGSLRQHSASSYHNFPKVASTHHLEMAQNPQAGREEDVGERIMQEPAQLSKLPEIPVHVCGTAAWTA